MTDYGWSWRLCRVRLYIFRPAVQLFSSLLGLFGQLYQRMSKWFSSGVTYWQKLPAWLEN